MRELKFRIYVQELKLMIYDVYPVNDNMVGMDSDTLEELLPKNHYIDWDSSCIRHQDWDNDIFDSVCEILTGEDWVWFEDVDIMQYTGKEDKNGKEIYEKDIIKNIHHYAGTFIELVYFDKETTAFSPLHKFHKSFEVLGNIYENPELLNK